ncbi:MOXD1 homolog 2-like [Apis florea]|uniref:MOXD1 homolog 2-like n=1 Tax=Apis florea TaxID=7463 RepID=UPI0006298160|nr:MOXD1 homolog 2-like [Apis florea]
MDSSQDYCLLLGYENKTHTVLRFSRRYDTCDPRDLKITASGRFIRARPSPPLLLNRSNVYYEIGHGA